MPRLQGRKLDCFYCGCRSAQKYTQGLREWQCNKCDAVNYLDKNGEITDPPALQVSSQTRYAQARPRSASPEIAQAEEPLFCQTCLKNQHLLTQSLAEYYPPSDHPDYAKYEREYPQYRKNLEDRYPQICEQCEPRVRARIQETGYAAKTDHLRRMMEQTRGTDSRRQGWGWKSTAVAVGGAAWYLGLFGQFSWHFINVRKVDEDSDSLYEAVTLPSLSNCLRQDVQNPSIAPACARVYSSAVGFALCLGLLSIWWNPGLKQQFKPKRGRIIGMGEYYKLQVTFLAVRFAVWSVLSKTPTFDIQTAKGIHAFMLVFMSVIISYRTVQVDYTPLAKFQDRPRPLIAQRSQQGLVNITKQPSYSQRTQSYMQNSERTARAQPFPIGSLAPTPQQQYPPSGAPLTPPLDEDDSEAMDWTPSQGSFHPTSSHRSLQPKPTLVQPSPFYGKLPPNPMSQNHRLRNAPNQPTFFKPSTPQPQNLFNRMLSPSKQDDFSDVGSEPSPSKQATFSPQFAPPKFFAPSDHRDDTGLESIFSNTFTIGDEPAEVRTARQQEQNRLHQATALNPAPISTSTQRALTSSLVLVSIAWYYATTLPLRFFLPIRLMSVGLTALVAGRNLLQAMRKDKAFWSLSDMLVFGCELGLAIYLSSVIKGPPSVPFVDNREGPENLGLGLLGVMSAQEVWIAINESFKHPFQQSAATPALPPAPAHAPALTSPPTKPNTPLRQQSSPTLMTSSLSALVPTRNQPPSTLTTPAFSSTSSFSSQPPPSTSTTSSFTRAPTSYYPSFSTTLPSQPSNPYPSTRSHTSSYSTVSPAPTYATLTPEDSSSAYGGTPKVSTFTRSQTTGRRESDIGGFGGLNLGEGRRRQGGLWEEEGERRCA